MLRTSSMSGGSRRLSGVRGSFVAEWYLTPTFRNNIYTPYSTLSPLSLAMALPETRNAICDRRNH